MRFKKNLGKIIAAVIISMGIVLSPPAKGLCLAETYTRSVTFSSDGRYVYDEQSNPSSDAVTHYFYGGSSGITFSYYFFDPIPDASASVFKDGSLEETIYCHNTYNLTIDANKIYKIEVGRYKLSAFTGYKINFKDKGGAAFTGSLSLENQYVYYSDVDFMLTATPTRAGYTFKGWFDDSDCTIPHAGLTGPITLDPSLTVYALWEKNNNSASYEGRLYNLVDEINRLSKEDSKEVRTIFFSEGSSLPLMVMEALNNSNETVKLDFISEYDGKKYHFVISGGTNPHLSKDIPWYGPLWLNQYYSVPLE